MTAGGRPLPIQCTRWSCQAKRPVRSGYLASTGARVTPGIKKGVAFIPFHYVECAANTLTNNALDPTAAIPEFKACAVRIEKIKEA